MSCQGRVDEGQLGVNKAGKKGATCLFRSSRNIILGLNEAIVVVVLVLVTVIFALNDRLDILELNIAVTIDLALVALAIPKLDPFQPTLDLFLTGHVGLSPCRLGLLSFLVLLLLQFAPRRILPLMCLSDKLDLRRSGQPERCGERLDGQLSEIKDRLVLL